MGNMTQRDVFWNKIYELAKVDRNVVIVSADMGAPALDKFRSDLPRQFVNVGIAEQNAILVAAGLAMTGKRAFAYAIAPFITLRCLEQIRVENSIMNIPITIVGVGAGFGYDDSGPTHHMVEDIAVMRSMPNITINSVSDNVMAKALATMCCSADNTNYVRLDRQLLPDIYDSEMDFSDGVAVLREGGDACLIATGNMVHVAIDVADGLKGKDLDIRVIDVFRFPINESLLIESAAKTKKIITLEEHFLPGGLGSAVLECLSDHNLLIPTKRLGPSFSKGHSYTYGGRDVIHRSYGIDQRSVEASILSFLSA